MGNLSRGFWFWLSLGAIIGALAGFGWGKFCGEQTCPEARNTLLGALLGLGLGIVAAFFAERRGDLRLRPSSSPEAHLLPVARSAAVAYLVQVVHHRALRCEAERCKARG